MKAIPRGGYVRIIGMSNLEEVDPEDEPRTYRQGRYRDRLKVVLAGVTVNLLIAFLLFFVVIVGRGPAEGPSTTVDSRRAATAPRRRRPPGGRPDRRGRRRSRSTGWDELKAAIETNGGETRSSSPSTATARQVDVDGDTGGRERPGLPRRVARPPRSATSGLLEAVPESFNVMGRTSPSAPSTRSASCSRRRGVESTARTSPSDAPEAGSQRRPRAAALAGRDRRPGQRHRRRRPLGAAAACSAASA